MGRSDQGGASGDQVGEVPPEVAGDASPEPTTDPDLGNVANLTRTAPKATLRAELLVRNGPVAGLRFGLRDGVVTVGRSSTCECPVHDEAVSRRHFELIVGPGGVVLRDLGSGNGTKLNGQRVGEVRLRPGDRILAGNSVIEFREVATAEGTSGVGASAGGDVPRQRRRLPWVQLAMGLASFLVVIGTTAAVLWVQRRGRQAVATALFERGRAELAHDPPDPDLALADLQAAQPDYPDRRALQDALADEGTVAEGLQRLARARTLAAQRNFEAAIQNLTGLPETPYFVRTRDALMTEFIALEATPLPEAPHPPAPVIRTLPTTAKPKQMAVRQVDDDRADQLCDEADALLGRDPAAAARKYREALRYARPGGVAAQRAQAGIE